LTDIHRPAAKHAQISGVVFDRVMLAEERSHSPTRGSVVDVQAFVIADRMMAPRKDREVMRVIRASRAAAPEAAAVAHRSG
jgi:hypothetical protein